MNRDWYEALDDFRDQPQWLINNSDLLYETIEHDLQHPVRQSQALDAFLTLFPIMVRSEALKQWVSLADHAIRQVIAAPQNKTRIQESEWLIGGRYFIRRMDHTENLRPPPSRRRRRVRINPRQLYEQYLLLLMVFFCEHKHPVDERHITQMLAFARSVNHPFFYHKTYQAAAVIYNEWQRFDQAQTFAALSYEFFQRTGSDLEAALSAYELANAHCGLGDVAMAESWLEAARQHAVAAGYSDTFELIVNGRHCG